jgi:5-methylcytosine-specific restriction protein A
MAEWVTGRTSSWKRSNRYGYAWQLLRKQILARDPDCQLALPDVCTGRSAQVDHILPVSEGGSDEASNLRGVCKACHRKRTARQGLEARRRRKTERARTAGA